MNSYLRVVLASNNEWIVPDDPHERRYCVVRSKNTYCGRESDENKDYFDKVRGVPSWAWAHYLYTRDLSRFRTRLPPLTAAAQQQREFTMDPILQWWAGLLSSGDLSSCSLAKPDCHGACCEAQWSCCECGGRIWKMMMHHDDSRTKSCCENAWLAAERACWDDEDQSMVCVSVKPGRERLEGWEFSALRVPRRAMFRAYVDARRMGGGGYRCTEKAFWSKMREAVTLGDGGRPRIHKVQHKCVVVPPLDVCKSEFRQRVGGGTWSF